MEKFGIGQEVLREEDPRLLRGNGLFVNDVELPGQAYAVVLRSPHAHADIRGIDTEAAAALPIVPGLPRRVIPASDADFDATRAAARRAMGEGFAPNAPAIVLP